ncbi:MAG: flavodoxin-dependent (E)-4-hydroxy-3-methylbut-2-enyl-diphosphate synthase [Candidatus Aminicenantia bacterium]
MEIYYTLIKRKRTKEVRIGNFGVGGDNPIRVQSMTKTDTKDVKGTLSQIESLKEVGCEIVRVAIPDEESAFFFKEIRKNSPIPIVADIHFNYRLALKAIEYGADGIRINPGNIGDRKRIGEITKLAKERGIPIRIGVNSGSIEKDLLEKFGSATVSALVESVKRNIKILEDLDFTDIKISVKASDVERTVEAYRRVSELTDYPLHIGITESGTLFSGTIKSAIGIGILLYEGIGDTIRVSLSAPPEEEVKVGWEILKALGLRRRGIEIISCPTCGRLEVDLLPIVSEIERRVFSIDKNIKIAIMGCVVNGPGEAREADLALVCGKGVGLLYKKGELLRKVKENNMVEEFMKELQQIKD